MSFSEPDDERLPIELRPLAVALDRVPTRPPAEVPGGVDRGSWLSPGVCLRLDLGHPALASSAVERLRHRHPDRIGTDAALYAFGIDSRSRQVLRRCESAP